MKMLQQAGFSDFINPGLPPSDFPRIPSSPDDLGWRKEPMRCHHTNTYTGRRRYHRANVKGIINGNQLVVHFGHTSLTPHAGFALRHSRGTFLKVSNRCPMNSPQRFPFKLPHQHVQKSVVAVTNPMVIVREVDYLWRDVFFSEVSRYVSIYVGQVQVH